MAEIRIVDTTESNVREFGVCGYKNPARAGYPEKLAWLHDRFAEGLRIKTLVSAKDGAQGMIEYIPGEHCWRPVVASGYMVIHCIFCGFKKAYKGQGYGSMLLAECIRDAREQGMHGVSVVTRQGAFMAGRALFLKHGFDVVDTAPPDFELMTLVFDDAAPLPKFNGDWASRIAGYGSGLTIIRSDQCPYTVKNVNEICEMAEKTFGIAPTVISLANSTEAQRSPCAFGTFAILYNGDIVAYHPISKTRFSNIMKKLVH